MFESIALLRQCQRGVHGEDHLRRLRIVIGGQAADGGAAQGRLVDQGHAGPAPVPCPERRAARPAPPAAPPVSRLRGPQDLSQFGKCLRVAECHGQGSGLSRAPRHPCCGPASLKVSDHRFGMSTRRRPFSPSLTPCSTASCRAISDASPSTRTICSIAAGVPMDATRRTMNGSRMRHLGRRRQVERSAGVFLGQRLRGVPVHQRQVVVAGILRVCEQSFQHVPALGRRQALQAGRDVQPHHRRLIARRQLGHRPQDSITRLPLLQGQLHRPGPHIIDYRS